METVSLDWNANFQAKAKIVLILSIAGAEAVIKITFLAAVQFGIWLWLLSLTRLFARKKKKRVRKVSYISQILSLTENGGVWNIGMDGRSNRTLLFFFLFNQYCPYFFKSNTLGYIIRVPGG